MSSTLLAITIINGLAVTFCVLIATMVKTFSEVGEPLIQ